MWKIDTTQTGISSMFREYEWYAIDHIYKARKGITSMSTNEYVNEFKRISRASIIGLLKKLAKAGILASVEVSGKGGFHPEYHILVEREDLPRKIAMDALKTIQSVFPTDAFLSEVQGLPLTYFRSLRTPGDHVDR